MKAKKLLGVLLALALAAMCFGCGGPAYTEVAEKDYATTIESFSDAIGKIEDETSGGFKMTMKQKAAEGEVNMTAEMWMTATEEIVKLDFSMKEGSESIAMKVYVTDDTLYAELSGELAELAGKNKVKMSMNDSMAGGFGGSYVEMVEQTFNGVLQQIATLDPTSIGKLEVSGKEGEDRWLKITITEDGDEGTIEIKVDKDGNLAEIKVAGKGENMNSEMSMTRIFAEPTLPDLTAFEDLPSMGA